MYVVAPHHARMRAGVTSTLQWPPHGSVSERQRPTTTVSTS